jgi:lipoprotein-releasing system ATP-binding protein
MNNILEIENLSKSYKFENQTVKIIEEANLLIREQEIIGLVGSSGIGKSTLLHIIGMLDSFDNGNVLFLGQNCSQISDKEKTRLRNQKFGFVYQFHYLLTEFSALENIIIPQLPSGVSFKHAKKRSEELMKKVGLLERIHHKPSQLSGGEQQRVAICRALANKPSLLIADEPTGNLDFNNSRMVFNLLKDVIKEEQMSAIIATHDMSLARQMDRQITINEECKIENIKI